MLCGGSDAAILPIGKVTPTRVYTKVQWWTSKIFPAKEAIDYVATFRRMCNIFEDRLLLVARDQIKDQTRHLLCKAPVLSMVRMAHHA